MEQKSLTRKLSGFFFRCVFYVNTKTLSIVLCYKSLFPIHPHYSHFSPLGVHCLRNLYRNIYAGFSTYVADDF
jgi:hypothetical protein